MDADAQDAPVRVLFIEDDPAVAQMYQLKLQLDGYQVTIARDGEAGLRMAREDPPDMVFLDIRLPKMDGLAVLEAIRANDSTSHLPVVILSNYAEKDLVERGLRLGALEYLIKSKTNPGMLSGGMDGWLAKG
ncbi:MAG: response regulator [Chloroflexi bacterium]|nr:MAG: response regulator [Chloroflexota bacterium]TME17286.1 MAG: response regulator [Chloroflexota bacterium]